MKTGQQIRAELASLVVALERECAQLRADSQKWMHESERLGEENAALRGAHEVVSAANERLGLAAIEATRESDAWRAALDAVRALHQRGTQATSEHYYCKPGACDRAGEGELAPWCWCCSEPWPCQTLAAAVGAAVADTPDTAPTTNPV
jgi:hypothetical protein